MRRFLFLSLVCLTIPMAASAQAPDTIRVCTYNLLQFGSDDADRTDEMFAILSEISPSILVVQETLYLSSQFLFSDSVALRLPAPLIGNFGTTVGEDSHVMMYFDTTKLKSYINYSFKAKAGPRQHHFYGFIVKSTGDTINIVTGHLKAGNTRQDEIIRWEETRYLKQIIDTEFRPNLVYAADFNIYSSNEGAYRTLMSPDSNRPWRFFDLIDRPGEWHDNPEFADIHTANTRASQVGGGMENRFDQILVTEGLLDNVRPETYTTFGNDGQHFNDSINAQPNTAVSAEMAQALHDASDHLPVFVDFVFGATSDVTEGDLPDELDLTVTPSSILPEE